MTASPASTPDPGHRYWLRAHKRALHLVRCAHSAYEHAWQGGAPAFVEWEQPRAADRRERFTYQMLCRVMDWR